MGKPVSTLHPRPLTGPFVTRSALLLTSTHNFSEKP